MAGQFVGGMVDKLDDIEIVDGRVIQLMAQSPPATGRVCGWPRCSRLPGKLAVPGERESISARSERQARTVAECLRPEKIALACRLRHAKALDRLRQPGGKFRRRPDLAGAAALRS